MIRFIDLRGQETDGRFAFYDTVPGCFVNLDGEQVFDTFQDFEEAYNNPERRHRQPHTLERFAGLAPEWTRIPGTELAFDEGRCTLCIFDPDHHGACKNRNELMTELAGEP